MARDGGGGAQLPGPVDLALAPTGEIYVLEQDALAVYRVVKLNSSGVFIMQWGADGSGPGEFNAPQGIATDATGKVYVADTQNHRIQVFDSGGGFITQWGTQNPADHAPVDLVVAGSTAYVISGEPARVEIYSTSGTFLNEWPIILADETQTSAGGIAMDAAGALHLSDTWNSRVKKFTTSGALPSYWDGTGNASGGFMEPTRMDIDYQGSIFIADYQRIQKYAYSATPTRSISWGRLKSAYR